MKNRRSLLARRPHGAIQDSRFNFVETDESTPTEGEVLVRNLMLSCDPTQRCWMAFDTYLSAVKIGEVVRSIRAGRIVASKYCPSGAIFAVALLRSACGRLSRFAALSRVREDHVSGSATRRPRRRWLSSRQLSIW
jgi:hypothetical protein